ncbi:hypothetical protein ACIBCA_18705 [Kitasatospora sp. NPDC051170]|uniref:hypothetical protein n=1 Tax=Kitasatospora sp. NPDC051170 TaxID=3364056 RepID=UPI00378B07D0
MSVRKPPQWIRGALRHPLRTVRRTFWALLPIAVLLAPEGRRILLVLLVAAVVLWLQFRIGRLTVRHAVAVWKAFFDKPAEPLSEQTGDEPVRPGYLRQAGPEGLRTVWRELWRLCVRELTWPAPDEIEVEARKSRFRYVALTVRSVALVVRVASVVLGVPTVLASGVLVLPALLGQLLLWALLAAGSWLLTSLCAALDLAARRLRGAATVCPHPACGRAVALPARRCPTCGAAHRRLVPGRFGAVRRTCVCGHRLPAATLFGAWRLDAQCPHCARPMLPGDVPIRLVLAAGAPDSGRGAVVRQAVTQLADHLRPFGGEVGAGPRGTTTARLSGLRGGRRSLALLAPPERLLLTADGFDAVEGLHHAHGLLLTLDARQLPGVRRALTASDRTRLGLATADGPDQVEVVERVLRAADGLPPGSRPRRIAVVLTGTAALDHTSVGPVVGSGEAAPEAAVRTWLATAGAGNLVRTLDHTSVPVRFLTESSADASPDLAGMLLWTAGIPIAAAARPRPVRPVRPVRPARSLPKAGSAIGPRYGLLLSHFAGLAASFVFLFIPLVASLPPVMPRTESALPSSRSEPPLPSSRADSHQDPLTKAYGHVYLPPSKAFPSADLTRARSGVSWPAFSADYSAPGSSPDGPRVGTEGHWSTAGSPNAGKPGSPDWIELDFGVRVEIRLVDVVVEGTDPVTVRVQVPGAGGGWAVPDNERDDTSVAHLHEISVPVTASALRITVEGGKDGVDIGGLAVWSPAPQRLRLHPSGAGLEVSTTSDTPVPIEVFTPDLPAGWRATPDGALPRQTSAAAPARAAWRFTGPAGEPPRPVLYAVGLPDHGIGTVAECVALVRLAPEGPVVQPVTCAKE